MKKTAKRNRKQEYINECRHDMDYMQKVIGEGKPFFYWHGERHSLKYAKETLAYLTEELNVVFSNKNYKPWFLRG